MPEAHVLRPRFGRFLAGAVMIVCAAAAVVLLVQSPVNGAAALPMLGLLAFIAWAAYWRPSVRVDDDAVTVENVFRTMRVPYGQIQRIDTRYALTLYTPERRIVAWAAPAPGRHKLMTIRRDQAEHLPESSYVAGTVRPGDLTGSDSGVAAYIVRSRWEQLRDAESLDAHTGAVDVRLHTVTIAAGAALVAALALALFV